MRKIWSGLHIREALHTATRPAHYEPVHFGVMRKTEVEALMILGIAMHASPLFPSLHDASSF